MTNLFETSRVEGRVLLVGLEGTSVQALGHRLVLGDRDSAVSSTAHLENITPMGGSGTLVTQAHGVTLTFWAIKSGSNTRKLWSHYYPNADAVVLLVVEGESDFGNDDLDSAWTELTTNDELLESELVVVVDTEGTAGSSGSVDASNCVIPAKFTRLGMHYDQMVRVDAREGIDDLLKKLSDIIKNRRKGK